MKEVLLVSTYESGFQSLGTTVAAAHLKKAAVPCRLLDLSLVSAPPPEEARQRYGMVGFHVPMYHALPQSFNLASRIRTLEPRPKIFFFGLYASLFRDEILGKYGDQVFNTNWEDELIEWVLGQGNGHGLVQLSSSAPVDPARPAYAYQRQERFLPPARDSCPTWATTRGSSTAGRACSPATSKRPGDVFTPVRTVLCRRSTAAK